MEVYNKEEVKMNQEKLLHRIYKGAVFLYPTDTIYGIGCNAKDSACVEKIREAKQRDSTPFSVIAPNKQWIYDNCHLTEEAVKWIEDKLPGPYTIILKLKNKDAIAENVAPGKDTVGVRIPNHWCSKAVSIANIPLITTSANIHGEEFMTSLDNLNPIVQGHMDFIIYEGELDGRPSKIVDFSKNGTEIIER